MKASNTKVKTAPKAKKATSSRVVAKTSAVEVSPVKTVQKNGKTIKVNKKKLFIVFIWIAVFLVSFTLVDFFVQYQNNDASIAVVNGERIYKEDFYKKLEDFGLADNLEVVIFDKMLEQAAIKENILPNDQEVEAFMKKFYLDMQGTQGDLKTVIEQSGKNYNRVKSDITNLLILAKRYPYTQDDLKNYFDQNTEEISTTFGEEAKYDDASVKIYVEFSYIYNVIANDKGAEWIQELQATSNIQNNLSAKPAYEIFKQTRNLINGLLNKSK